VTPWSTGGKNRIPHQVDGENSWRGQNVSGSASCRNDVTSKEGRAGPQGVF